MSIIAYHNSFIRSHLTRFHLVSAFLPENDERQVNFQQTPPPNDPSIKERVPLTSPLSYSWNHLPSKWNGKVIRNYAITYVFGMVGFALALVWRIIRLAGRMLLLIKAFVKAVLEGNWIFLRDHGIRVAITLGKVFSAVIGIFCPPAAYKIDDTLDKRMPPFDQSVYYVIYQTNVITAYELLGLPFDTPLEQTHQRYRQLARELHPDKGAEEHSDFTLVQDAWERIKNYFEQQ